MTQENLAKLEQELINSDSLESARGLISNLSKNELIELANYLKAYPQRKTAEAFREQIVRSTYSAVRQSQIIRNLRLK